MLKVIEHMLTTLLSVYIGDNSTECTLNIADNASDSITGYHNVNGSKFTTADNDNDIFVYLLYVQYQVCLGHP